MGIPKSYRFMPGFGVHTFRLLNKAGKETLVKFHWVPKQGEGKGGGGFGVKFHWVPKQGEGKGGAVWPALSRPPTPHLLPHPPPSYPSLRSLQASRA